MLCDVCGMALLSHFPGMAPHQELWMKRATIYKRALQIFVHPLSRTTDGVWMLTEPIVRQDPSATDAQVGGAIQEALSKSLSAVPHPRNWSGVLEPLLRQAGVRSWRNFAAPAVCVQVEQEQDKVYVVPTNNLGANEGFEEDTSRRVCVATGLAADLGASARLLLLRGLHRVVQLHC
jgi:hypothetical protein